MKDVKHRHWHDQIEAVAGEISRLAIACNMKMMEPGIAERVLHGDESVCGRKNPEAFRKLRKHLMAFFQIRDSSVKRLGAKDTQEILDGVRAAIQKLRDRPTH